GSSSLPSSWYRSPLSPSPLPLVPVVIVIVAEARALVATLVAAAAAAPVTFLSSRQSLLRIQRRFRALIAALNAVRVIFATVTGLVALDAAAAAARCRCST
ncbi:hypothetical protein FKP32DRAFT_1670545, partial [Trametes sanguinea]